MQEFSPEIVIEMKRSVRFHFEEHLEDGYSQILRMADAMDIWDEALSDGCCDASDPPPEVWEMADQMGTMYEAALAEWIKWKADFLARIGPEMPD